ncbi:MAG: hypothetical protein VZR00_07460 [Lachnospiraceae bacterium]|jgi:uncharacterized membrane protein|nr:hypothetical protein [Lachnospiraceae bacterium]MEE3461704.1 hypothetical protein [Lachnospiraceae bacterium]
MPVNDSSSKTIAVLSYVTVIGFGIAMLLYSTNKQSNEAFHDFERFHINQGLVVNIVSLLTCIPVFGRAAAILCIIMIAVGVYGGATGTCVKIPVIGDIHLLK